MRLPQGTGAVVTGAGSGLGRALALDLARRGARVMVSDIRGDAADETVELVRAGGGTAFANLCDVSQVDQVEALAEEARRKVGEVAFVCNNAGVAVAGRFEQIPLEDFEWIVGINLWGVIHGCRAFMPAMRERQRGWVINVASAAGLLATPLMSAYNVTKAGVITLSETLWTEYRGAGVNVSVLCPTFFDTQIMENARGAGPGLTKLALRRMKASKLTAEGVARAAVDGVLAGRLYVVPMRDGRVLWRVKRLLPGGFYRLMSMVHERVEKRVGLSS